MVKPYIYTEWAVRWTDGQISPQRSALIARDFAENWNSLMPTDPVEVVQRSISEWGTEQ